MILLEKYDITHGKEELLNSWTLLFNTVDELLKFLNDNKLYIIGTELNKFKLVIRDITLNSEVN